MPALWKAFKKLPFVHCQKRQPPKESGLQLLELPEDIVHEIANHLGCVRSLCNLSLTCTQLYYTLLPSHLHQHGVSDPFHEIRLDGRNCTDATPALRLLIYDSPIRTFSWRAGDDPRTLVREMEQLRRLIARITIIEYLELDFSNNWPIHEFRYGYENGYWAWVRLFTNLLHVVAQRCHFVVITNHYQVLSPWVTFIGGVPYNLDPPLLERITTEWRQSSKSLRLAKSPSKISLSHPDNAPTGTTKKTAFPQPFPPEKSTTVYATKRLIINDPGLFQRSLFGEWALDWVNNMPLTHLVIHQGRMRLPLLRQIRLPHLTSLTISHGYGLSTCDIVQVLQNNERLNSIDFLDTKLDVSNAIIMVKKRSKHQRAAMDIGQGVESIKGSASFLRGILDLELAFQRLNTVVVQVRGDGRSEQAHLQRLYKSLAGVSRDAISNLVFEFPAPCEKRGLVRLDSWLEVHEEIVLDAGVRYAASVKEGFGSSPRVKVVHLRYTGTSQRAILCSSDDASHLDDSEPPLHELLSRWTTLFPALREVRLSHILDPNDRHTIQDVVQALSPKVSVSIDGALVRSGRLGYGSMG